MGQTLSLHANNMRLDEQTWTTGRRSGVRSGPLDPEGCDEDVDDHDDEHKCCGDVLHDVQLVVHAFVVQVPLN